jgi:hypothetical protein
MLTVGGIFWRSKTPAFASQSDHQPALVIPRGAVCDVRNYAEDGAHVKVRVDASWQPVWVHRLPPDHRGLRFYPFLTFAYLTHGTEAQPDLHWELTERSLLSEARREARAMTREELTTLFGEELVD